MLLREYSVFAYFGVRASDHAALLRAMHTTADTSASCAVSACRDVCLEVHEVRLDVEAISQHQVYMQDAGRSSGHVAVHVEIAQLDLVEPRTFGPRCLPVLHIRYKSPVRELWGDTRPVPLAFVRE